MASSRPAWLKPGQMIEAEFAQKIGVSRIALQRWRSKGLPFIKEGKYVVYDEQSVMPWLRAKMLSDVMRNYSSLVTYFLRDFRECTEMGQNAANYISASISKAMSSMTLTDSDKRRIEASMEEARRDQIMKLQAASMYAFARDLQLTSPQYIVTHDELDSECDAVIEITDENVSLVKAIVCHLFPSITSEYADEMASIMESAYIEIQTENESGDDRYELPDTGTTAQKAKRTAIGG